MVPKHRSRIPSRIQAQGGANKRRDGLEIPSSEPLNARLEGRQETPDPQQDSSPGGAKASEEMVSK